jgi:CIC family chloride channel protein
MLSGVIVAAAIAAAVERGILGQHPVFEIRQAYTLGHATTLVSYAILGGMLGGTIGYVDVNVFHRSADSIGAFALVGMGAVFAGIVRAPMTSVVIIFEMTGSYELILRLMIANMSAYGLAWHGRPLPIYEALLLQDEVVLPHGKPITPENAEAELPGEVPP